jgi:iron complex outermembrane recepter protein
VRALGRARLLVALGLLLCSLAHAADQQPRFNIAPGPLQPALERLASQTGMQILYDPALLEGRVTQGVAGAMPPRKAVAKLLENTDIAFNFTADDAVALFRKSKPQTFPTVGNNERPRTVTISTNRTLADPYNAETSVTATRVDESFLNVPLSSESVTAGVLRDLQVNRLEDALQYVSGAEIAPNGQSALGFILRGFPTYQYYLDGVRVAPDTNHDAFRDFANVERIEVVKGPASLLYGRTEPGGAINVITKQPLADPHLSVEQQAGSFGYKRTEIDAGGPVPATDSLLYRVNAAYEDDNSFRDIAGNHRIFLAPVLTWNSSAVDSWTVYGEFLDSHDKHDSGLPVVGDRLPPVPIARSLEVGGDIHTKDYRVGMKGSYEIPDIVTLRHHLDFRWVNAPQAPQAALSDDGLDAGTCTAASCPVNRELVSMPSSRGNTYYASLEALTDFSLWDIEDTVLVGGDFFGSRATSRLIFRNDPGLATDLLHPSATPIDWSLLQDPDSSFRAYTREEWEGAYIQNQVRFSDTVRLLLGGRFDEVHEGVRRAGMTKLQGLPYPPGTINTFDYGQTDNLQSLRGRAGLLWHPLQALSAYANFSQNFGVTAGLYAGDGNVQLQLLPDEHSQEWEVGLKLESPDGGMAATFAWFDLVKHNIATPILSPALDNSSISFVMQGAHNRGLEADFRGELAPNLQLLANYAFTSSRIENTLGQWGGGPPKNAELVGDLGDRLYGVPRHSGSLWASYHVAGGASNGLKLGFGAVARSTREGDNLNDYELPAFVKFSALAAYGWRATDTNFEVQLNVDNLLDKRYFESLSGTRTVMPGTPRRFIATVRASF